MLNIGDFARLAGVSVRMLRHYDDIGLLVPTQVDPSTGYRRYDADLIVRAHRLVALRELGFSLDRIGRLLDEEDPAKLRDTLAERRQELITQVTTDTARLREIERRLRLVEGEPAMALEFEEKDLPALDITGASDTVPDHDAIPTRVGPSASRPWAVT
jgi:DNA-binding transcriptional MerR regulator